MRRLIVAVALCLIAVPAIAQSKVPVYVTSAGAQNGMTDPSKDNRDTVKDLREAIADRKSLTVAQDRDSAAIVLIVMGRETQGVTAGFLGNPARDRSIRVQFHYGDVQTEMSASAQGGTLGSGGSWGKAAGKIAKQVDQWVAKNANALGR